MENIGRFSKLKIIGLDQVFLKGLGKGTIIICDPYLVAVHTHPPLFLHILIKA